MTQMEGGNELISVNVFEKVGLEAGMHVGDLGCGNLGYFAVPAARLVGKGGVVYAVDILKSVLEAVGNRARQEGLTNIQTIWSNLEIIGATKIPEGSLDLSMLHNMLFQSDKDDLVVKETYRLTKAGGKVLMIDWLKIEAPFGPPMADRPSPEDLKRYAKDAGLSLIEEFSAGPYHFGLLFTK
jgi:ubiquinone/menaquinone biosynthesis C-methylase UbiE